MSSHRSLTGSINRFSDGEFRGIEEYPTENTATVNLTHQQLSSLKPPFDRLVAIAPSRYQEGTLSPTNDPRGYDVKLETAKEIVFQHKSPDNTVVRDGKQWLNYKVDMRQMKILFHHYSPREAFYALPATPQIRQLRDGLNRTIFVDVWPLYTKYLKTGKEISRIYVEYKADPTDLPTVRSKFNSRKWTMQNGPYWDLTTSKRIYEDSMTWDPIQSELRDCHLGLPIRGVEGYPYRETELDPPGFQPEFFESLHPVYREHVKRRYALRRYAEGGDREETLEWMITSLQQKLEDAYQQDWQIGGPEFSFSDGLVRERLRGQLDELVDRRRDPIDYIQDTHRCVLEKGARGSTITV